MAKALNIAGQKFGKLTAIEPQGKDSSRNQLWLCHCECGNQKIAAACSLRRGFTRSCGCLNFGKANHYTHGMNRTPEYHSWCSMIQRCENTKVKDYKHYGGRGIKIHQPWREDFSTFLKDMGPRPSIEHTLDRILVNGNYEPGNCQWATKEEQARNKRNNVFVIHENKKITLAQMAKITGVPKTTLRRHLAKENSTLKNKEI